MVRKTLVINGVTRNLVLSEDETLAKVLREHLLLTGCKIGCGEGHCGACNVIMNGKVTKSCIVKMSKVPDNAEITTIEGVGTISDMHPLQVAWMAHGCAQCGFCTPGFIISAKVLLEQNPNPTREEVRDWFNKTRNLCRCTGYKPLVDAVMDAAAVLRGEMTKEDLVFKPTGDSIKGTKYIRPSAAQKVTGTWDFGADDALKMPGCLRLALTQAKVSHANIKSIDTSEAEKMPGVVKVITYKDILAAGGTIRIYDSSLKNCERKTYKKHGSAYQDVGAGGGIIYACHSVKKGNLKNGTGENYVDLFRESDGAYLGSYFLNYGELESCVIEKGELVLLIHVKGEGRCFIQWTGVNVLGGEGAGGFGFDSGALAGTTGISKSDLEILSAYSVSLANSELVFLEDAKQTTADDAITGRYFNKLESKLGSKAGKPVKLYWFGKDRGKADYEGDLKRKLKGAVLYDREYEISESGDSIKITLKQRKAHEIMRDAFGLDPNASYVNATTKMTATEITGSDSDSATGSISGSGSASSTQDGIQKSIEWARNIAADDRFTYGKGYGDYYDCPVCHGSTKKSELKYTCNPFVAAAFAHGTGDPLLMNHGNHKVRTSDWNFEGNRSKIWKKVGLCKDLSWPDIQPGDIFIQYASGVGGHACIYGGGDELIEATSGSGITDRKSGAKKRFQSYQKGSKNFVMRYIGTGGGSGTSSSGSTVQSIGGWTGKSGNGECYLGNAASTKNMSQSGDQDGKEVLVSKCGTNWDYVIRWSDASKALAASKIMYDACKNDHVGYNNQNKAKSTSFYKQLVANKGDASAISENCDTACSQMVAAILRYLGVDMNDYVDSKSLYNTLKKRSEFTVYSSEAYTKSTSKLRPGDILMRVNGNNHTAMVVQTKDGMEGVEAIQGGDGEVYTGLTGGTATNGEAGYTLAENTAQLLFNGKTEVRTINMGSSSMQDVVFGGYSNGGELTFPLPKGTWTFTSDRGWRWGRLHEGVDLGAAKGTPIYAAAAGTVVRSEYYSGYGNCIDIDHGGGMVTRYGHQSKLIAKKGDTVQAGQKIGEVGNTGHSFGSHIHFGVKDNGSFQNPRNYLPAR